MDPDLIAGAVLFGPGAIALPLIAAAWHRSNRHADAERAMLADLHATHRNTATPAPGPGGPGGPGDPGQPSLVPAAPRPIATGRDAGPVAPVIEITTRRRAA